MQNLWNEQDAQMCKGDPFALRIYSSRLLGKEPDLVLHGGGNTSLKLVERDIFGEEEEILYIKGSGWDLAEIDKQGFAPVRRSALCRLITLKHLTDQDMMRYLHTALLNPFAPAPSVESILHAIIPWAYIDHTHADAIVTISNSANGEHLLHEIFGDSVLLLPYAMPGFKLAKQFYEATRNINWQSYRAIILLQHGVLTFADDAQTSYNAMISIASQAEEFLMQQGSWTSLATAEAREDLLSLAKIRNQVSQLRNMPVLAKIDQSPEACGFANLPNVKDISQRGPITTDHLIRTKPTPAVLSDDPQTDLKQFSSDYLAYFERHASANIQCSDLAPRWAIWPGHGCIAFGQDIKETRIISDIAKHTMRAIQQAEALGGWQALSEHHLFDMEYWELQRNKLVPQHCKHRSGERHPAVASCGLDITKAEFSGKIALVTGAASGIGLACVRALCAKGAIIAGLDINPQVQDLSVSPEILGIQCDVTDRGSLARAVEATVRHFGGIDILVCNAGTFPAGQTIEALDAEVWERSLAVNLTSQQRLLQLCIPYLKWGIAPSVVFIASRNVPAPGPGAAAYSVPKAGQTQLARIAALELGQFGIRVNILHPDCVYDTGIWSPATLERSAQRYNMTVEQYKARNILKTEVKSEEVAQMVCAMVGAIFAKTTGAQVPIDGGSDRVI